MGKYIRHLIGMLVAALMGGIVLPLLGLAPDTLSAEQAEVMANLSAALENVLWLFLTFAWYPLVEKFAKRFAWLDLEGYAGRLLTKQRAQQIDPSHRP